jgi:hypothetical protein
MKTLIHVVRNFLVGCLTAPLFLVGCALSPPPQPLPQPAVQADKTVNIDQSLLQKCPKIAPLPNQQLNVVDALNFINVLLTDYSICWHRQDKLSDLAASAFNLTPTSGGQATQPPAAPTAPNQ